MWDDLHLSSENMWWTIYYPKQNQRSEESPHCCPSKWNSGNLPEKSYPFMLCAKCLWSVSLDWHIPETLNQKTSTRGFWSFRWYVTGSKSNWAHLERAPIFRTIPYGWVTSRPVQGGRVFDPIKSHQGSESKIEGQNRVYDQIVARLKWSLLTMMIPQIWKFIH